MTAAEPALTARRRMGRVLQWTGIVIGALLILLLIALVVLDANADMLRSPIARIASAHLGRPVHIDGRLELHLFSWKPRAVVRQLRIENPSWVRNQPDTVRIGLLQVTFSYSALLRGDLLLPYVGIDDSDIVLIRDASQRAN